MLIFSKKSILVENNEMLVNASECCMEYYSLFQLVYLMLGRMFEISLIYSECTDASDGAISVLVLCRKPECYYKQCQFNYGGHIKVN